MTPRLEFRLRPFKQTSRDRYSRLLSPDPESTQVATDSRLGQLAIRMRDKKILGPAAPAQDLIPAGYTYFGQFIDHDMTYDTSALADYAGELKPEELRNHRARWLNLDNLYGDGPGSRDGELYEDDNLSFRLGQSDDGSVVDVPLATSDSRPLAADPRNLENVLVRQVHALFLKLHNVAASQTMGPSSIHDRFTQAKQRVTQQYQWLVRHDFLPRVCDPIVYKSVITDADPLIDWDHRFSIPVEFSQAAFRFGHSMVRSGYGLGVGHTVNIVDLLGARNRTGPLLARHRIDWGHFLNPPAGARNVEFAMPINTSIIPEFFDLPPDTIRAFVRLKNTDAQPFSLPFRTMKRGAMACLPSGQKACSAFRERAIWKGTEAWADLFELKLDQNIPLWYYILLEAELNGGGVRLGPLGSRIIIEVVEAALWSNPQSFLRQHGRHWRPPAWKTPQGMLYIESFFDVARATGTA